MLNQSNAEVQNATFEIEMDVWVYSYSLPYSPLNESKITQNQLKIEKSNPVTHIVMYSFTNGFKDEGFSSVYIDALVCEILGLTQEHAMGKPKLSSDKYLWS